MILQMNDCDLICIASYFSSRGIVVKSITAISLAFAVLLRYISFPAASTDEPLAFNYSETCL